MPQVNKNARTSSSYKKDVKAFTLIEMLLSTMLGGIVLGVVAFTFASVSGSFAEQPTTGKSFDWDTSRTVPYSPAYSQLSAAFNLQAEISDLLQTRSALSTLGDTILVVKNESTPPATLVGNAVTAIFVVSSDDGALPSVPDAEAPDVSSLSDLSGVAASSVTSNDQFRTLVKPSAAGVGYSIYFITDDDHVCMSVHCRVTDIGSGEKIYKVKAYQDGAFCPELSYAFGVRDTNSSVNPGVRTIKLRSDANWGINEDVATQVVLPDPSMVAYKVEAGDGSDVRTYSRFAILLPVKP